MDNKRFYRECFKAENLYFFNVMIDQTDLFIGAAKNLNREAESIVTSFRRELVEYIRRHEEFLHSLVPIEPLKDAPFIVRDMCAAAQLCGVGPMAAVAGAFSKHVGNELLKQSDEIIVENGGDIFIKSNRDRIIGIYAGSSPLSNKLAIRLIADMTPCGLCTSSGTVGHSLSFGKADAAVVLHPDASVADACATALGNRVLKHDDIEPALNFAKRIKGVKGALVIIGEALGAIGDIELCEL